MGCTLAVPFTKCNSHTEQKQSYGTKALLLILCGKLISRFHEAWLRDEYWLKICYMLTGL